MIYRERLVLMRVLSYQEGNCERPATTFDILFIDSYPFFRLFLIKALKNKDVFHISYSHLHCTFTYIPYIWQNRKKKIEEIAAAPEYRHFYAWLLREKKKKKGQKRLRAVRQANDGLRMPSTHTRFNQLNLERLFVYSQTDSFHLDATISTTSPLSRNINCLCMLFLSFVGVVQKTRPKIS